jgi:hypothetical protein
MITIYVILGSLVFLGFVYFLMRNQINEMMSDFKENEHQNCDCKSHIEVFSDLDQKQLRAEIININKDLQNKLKRYQNEIF